MTHSISSSLVSKMGFDHTIGNHVVRTDAVPPMSDDTGASPKRLLLAGLAGCTGIDVVMLLDKMRVPYTDIKMDVEADLTEEHPKVYFEIRLNFTFYGKDLNRGKVERAVNLSQEKYCGVAAMLQKNCPIVVKIDYVEE